MARKAPAWVNSSAGVQGWILQDEVNLLQHAHICLHDSPQKLKVDREVVPQLTLTRPWVCELLCEASTTLNDPGFRNICKQIFKLKYRGTFDTLYSVFFKHTLF